MTKLTNQNYSMSNPFDYVSSINETKEYMMNDTESEKGYNPFLTHRALSLFPQTIMLASEINLCQYLSNKMDYDCLFYGVSKGRRRSKFPKREIGPLEEAAMNLYDVDWREARRMIQFMNPEQKRELTETYAQVR